jgi:hypothetical protein
VTHAAPEQLMGADIDGRAITGDSATAESEEATDE